MTIDKLEVLDIPTETPLMEDIDGKLSVELDGILEEDDKKSDKEDTKAKDKTKDKDSDNDKDKEEVLEEDCDDKDKDKDEDDKDEDEKVEEAVSVEIPEIEVDLSEDVDAIFGSEELSDEFKEKAKGIFEAVVISQVKEKLQEEIEKVNAASIKKFEEAVEEMKDNLSEKVAGYLNAVTESWLDSSRVAVESQLKTKLAESFMTGIKSLFESHYVNTDNLQVDVVKTLEEERDDAIARLNVQIDHNVKLREAVIAERRNRITESIISDLSEKDKEKMLGLAEGVSYTDKESFIERLTDIKEAYFTEQSEADITVNSVEIGDTPIEIQEEVKVDKRDDSLERTLSYLKTPKFD